MRHGQAQAHPLKALVLSQGAFQARFVTEQSIELSVRGTCCRSASNFIFSDSTEARAFFYLSGRLISAASSARKPSLHSSASDQVIEARRSKEGMPRLLIS